MSFIAARDHTACVPGSEAKYTSLAHFHRLQPSGLVVLGRSIPKPTNTPGLCHKQTQCASTRAFETSSRPGLDVLCRLWTPFRRQEQDLLMQQGGFRAEAIIRIDQWQSILRCSQEASWSASQLRAAGKSGEQHVSWSVQGDSADSSQCAPARVHGCAVDE